MSSILSAVPTGCLRGRVAALFKALPTDGTVEALPAARSTWTVEAHGLPDELPDTGLDLTIGVVPLNFTGATGPAVTINGSIAAPLLGWCKGTPPLT